MLSNQLTAVGVLASLISLGAATNIHVNSGCIDINNQPICQTKGPSSVTINSGSATFYARFNPNSGNAQDNSGCVLSASWPSGYGDIYFGADDCLYDATGANIDGQCCENGSAYVTNPYTYYYG